MKNNFMRRVTEFVHLFNVIFNWGHQSLRSASALTLLRCHLSRSPQRTPLYASVKMRMKKANNVLLLCRSFDLMDPPLKVSGTLRVTLCEQLLDNACVFRKVCPHVKVREWTHLTPTPMETQRSQVTGHHHNPQLLKLPRKELLRNES